MSWLLNYSGVILVISMIAVPCLQKNWGTFFLIQKEKKTTFYSSIGVTCVCSYKPTDSWKA